MRLEAIVNGKQTVSAYQLAELKRKASRVANLDANALDEMTVSVFEGSTLVAKLNFTRQNCKAPNNTIRRGEWK